MSGIAGIVKPRNTDLVRDMLVKITHRGHSNQLIKTNAALLGITWSKVHSPITEKSGELMRTPDFKSVGYVSLDHGKFMLKRDPLGVVPMYFGKTKEGSLCFSSEV
jgi:asparagine synthetase B (glutamine-hydrolysing)